MSFSFWTLGAPLCLLALAAIAAVVLPTDEPVGVLGGVALLWLLLTGKARKTYWNARIRAKAYDDARRARSRTP